MKLLDREEHKLHALYVVGAVQGILAGVMVVDRSGGGGRDRADEAAFLASAVADSMIVLRRKRAAGDDS